jgi:cation-transporting ATPase I
LYGVAALANIIPTMPVIRLPAPSDLNPVPLVRGILGWLGNADGRRQRRASVSRDGRRAHIEVRGAHRQERASLVRDVKAALERLAGVDWAEVDALIGRAIIFFDPASVSVEDLVAAIQAVEDVHGAADERFPHDRPDHPADREPLQRNVFAIVADVVGVGVATGVQALRVARIPAEIPGLISIADSQPRVRRLLENRLGRPATDVTLVTANALSQALGQGPLGLVVDIAHRVNVVGELQARLAVWERREPEIVGDRDRLRPVCRSPLSPATIPAPPKPSPSSSAF